MNDWPHPDLVKITEIFLIPSSFLVAALGTADSNPHRAAVSFIGLVISLLWWICGREAFAELRQTVSKDGKIPVRIQIMGWLAALFVVGWLMSAAAHVWLWNQPLGHF